MPALIEILAVLLGAALVACFTACVLLAAFWYLPAAFGFEKYVRQHDRQAFDQAGFSDDGFPFDGAAFLRFMRMASYERLNDPRSRELGTEVARRFRVLMRLFVSCFVLFFASGLASLAAR